MARLQPYEVGDDTPLTDRETCVLQLIADGATNKEVGIVLSVSAETIKDSLASVRLKLGARNRTGAVAEALRRGLIR